MVKPRQEARIWLLIFKELDQGLLTIRRSWASSISETSDVVNAEDWRDWASSIAIIAIF